jgi:hypothetical protein
VVGSVLIGVMVLFMVLFTRGKVQKLTPEGVVQW